MPDPQANTITAEPYALEECTIQIGITILPADEQGRRMCAVGVRTHQDAPIFRMLERNSLDLPDILESMIDQLREEMPARKQLAEERARAKPAPQVAPAAAKPARPPVPVPAPKPAPQLDLFSMFPLQAAPPPAETPPSSPAEDEDWGDPGESQATSNPTEEDWQ